MRVAIVSSTAMAGVLLASFGLTACSSGSAPSTSSGGQASAEATASMDGLASSPAASGPDTSGDPVTTAAACAEINKIAADYMEGMKSDNAENWQAFSDRLLGLSDSAEDPAATQALMSLAVAASFTVTGLQSSEPLETAKGDFDTALSDMNAVCTTAGTPLT